MGLVAAGTSGTSTDEALGAGAGAAVVTGAGAAMMTGNGTAVVTGAGPRAGVGEPWAVPAAVRYVR